MYGQDKILSAIKKTAEFLLLFFLDLAVLVGDIFLYPLGELYSAVKEVPSKVSKIVETLQKTEIKLPKRKKSTKKKTPKSTKKKKVSKAKPPASIRWFIFGVTFSVVFMFIPFFAYSWFKRLPHPDLLGQDQNKSTKILDRKGRLLYEIYVDKSYDPVPLDKIPLDVINATIAVEDDKFFEHPGFRVSSMFRALRSILFESEIQGASTITQQLVKNVLLTPERTVSRKLKEVVLAVLVERRYTKNEILEMYLNNIPYGGTSWGVQSASQKYFGKDVWELNLAESSFLVGLPSAPSIYSPFNGNIDFAKQRQKKVLDRMVELGYISKLDANLAYSEALEFAPQASYIRAPHFVNYVREELNKTYGKRMVDFGGLTVVTTLDLDLQDQVQEIVSRQVAANEYLDLSNGAAVVADVLNGSILAYVGSKDYFAEDGGAFDVVTAYRSPGSSVKPITYALALSKKYTLASVIEDAPLVIRKYGQVYAPKNYDNQFHGKVTLRTALANSYNIPAVKLIQDLGVEEVVNLANKMGLSNWVMDSSYGLSVTLGGKEVRLLDLANVYATFARKGIYKDFTYIISVKDANGFEMYSDDRVGTRVVSEEVSYLLTDVLSDANARIPAFGYNNELTIPEHMVAVKTGTSDEKRDNVTVGFTPSYVVAVWVGNNDNSSMNSLLASGLSGAAPIWHDVMSVLLDGFENEPFKAPSGVFVKIDSECDNKSEVFIKGTAPQSLCTKDEESNNRRR